MSKRKSGKLPPFVAMLRLTMKSPAWKVLSVGARATLLELTVNYNSNAQNSVFLSERDGMKKLGVKSQNTVRKWMRELEYYGFIVKVKGHHLGVHGVGEAAHYRLTDRGYKEQAATYDFQNWDGVLFDPRPKPKRNGSAAQHYPALAGLGSG
jgi:hypothetical protein